MKIRCSIVVLLLALAGCEQGSEPSPIEPQIPSSDEPGEPLNDVSSPDVNVSSTPLPTLQPIPTALLTDVSVEVTVYPVDTMVTFPTFDPKATPVFDPILETIVSRVKDDHQQRTGISQEQIHVLEVEAVEWPDSSLGCGEPGTEYLPVITPGFRITLEADGRIYAYHTNTSDQIILCEQPRPIKMDPTP